MLVIVLIIVRFLREITETALEAFHFLSFLDSCWMTVTFLVQLINRADTRFLQEMLQFILCVGTV